MAVQSNRSLPIVKRLGRKRLIILPEEFSGRNLRSWRRKKKIPVLQRRMVRTKSPDGRNPTLDGVKEVMKRRNLVFWRRHLKDDPPMRRTKLPIHYQKMKRTKFYKK